MRKRLKIGLVATVAALLIVSAVAANTFYFHWVEVPFAPNNYHWSEPWTVYQMVDFLDAQLTITGCAYQGQTHDVELIITNVATIPDYYATSFAYTANWYVDETHQEVIIQGAYSGGLGVGETMVDTTTFQPSMIGAGDVKMDIIDIVWVQSEPITWTTEIIDNAGVIPESIDIKDFIITGASLSKAEAGTVSFTIEKIVSPQYRISFNVEIVELFQTVG
ncbi:MAG: hypothetical protein OEZ27_05545, partial [Nitrospinota bacterium]|nr:hypothetical protein [Nitrospinota bacterium]